MSLVLPPDARNRTLPPSFEAVKLCMVQGSTAANGEEHVSAYTVAPEMRHPHRQGRQTRSSDE